MQLGIILVKEVGSSMFSSKIPDFASPGWFADSLIIRHNFPHVDQGLGLIR